VFNQLSFCVFALALITHGSGCAADVDIATLESPETFPIRQDIAIAAGGTAISFTFDDGFDNHMLAAKMLEDRGMLGTFYVIASRLDQPGYLTVENVKQLARSKHEIGGHTFTHQHLPDLPVDEAARELCDSRNALMDLGLSIESLAYPFGDSAPVVDELARSCGYNSARRVGGLQNASSCQNCPTHETMIPAKPFAVRTPPSIKPDTTLEQLQGYVLNAEKNGGGWVNLVIHSVCDGCATNAMSPALLSQFLDWLAPRAARGTVVLTADQVIGGATKPQVLGPLGSPDPAQLLINPSFENRNSSSKADCWQISGGRASWTTSSQSLDGNVAQAVQLDILAQGTKPRIIAKLDMGSCAPSAQPGQVLRFVGHYRGTAKTIQVAYYRNRLGRWKSWARGPHLAASDTWQTAQWQMPPLPADATAVSVGFAVESAGSALFDDFKLGE
jgi:peptidoglycan/xylan/chitin deacetylase (PgdA/CDA1 family)